MMRIAERSIVIRKIRFITLLHPGGAKFLIEAPGTESVKRTALKPLNTKTSTETKTIVKFHDAIIFILAVNVGVEHFRPEMVFLCMDLKTVVGLLLAFLRVAGLGEVVRCSRGETIVLPTAGSISHERDGFGDRVPPGCARREVHASVPRLLDGNDRLDLFHVNCPAINRIDPVGA